MTYFVVVDSEGYEQCGSNDHFKAVQMKNDLIEVSGEPMQIVATDDVPKDYRENMYFD